MKLKQSQNKEERLPDACMRRWWFQLYRNVYPFINDNVELFGVEAAGEGANTKSMH